MSKFNLSEIELISKALHYYQQHHSKDENTDDDTSLEDQFDYEITKLLMQKIYPAMRDSEALDPIEIIITSDIEQKGFIYKDIQNWITKQLRELKGKSTIKKKYNDLVESYNPTQETNKYRKALIHILASQIEYDYAAKVIIVDEKGNKQYIKWTE
jgi:hypothetical protein